jgi:tetratricopeptide (TPR) repeat protein
VQDDVPVWSQKFDREVTDVFAIQEEISRGIVNSLRLKLGKGRRRYETSIEAYDFYLRARALQLEDRGFRLSLPLFENAITKDPSFAPAYAGLAAASATLSGTGNNSDRRENDLGTMRAAAEKAVQLDPLLPEGHDALGMAYARDGHWGQSEASFRRAIELDPNRSLSHADYGMQLLLVLGRIEEAIRQFQVAERLDPSLSEVHFFLGYGLTSAGRFDEAAIKCEKLPADYQARYECLGRARLGQGRIEEAIELFSHEVTRGTRGWLGYAYARAGHREDAERVEAEVSPNPFSQALIFAGLRDKERTLEALDRMVDLGPLRIGRALTFPEFAFLRGDPRVKTLRKKVGLPEL